MTLQIVETTRPVFLVGDQEFDTREEAEAELARRSAPLEYTYFLVSHDPDMGAGGRLRASTLIAAKKPASMHADVIALQYCEVRFGYPIGTLNGDPIQRWRLNEGQCFDSPDRLSHYLGAMAAAGAHGPVYLDDYGNPIP